MATARTRQYWPENISLNLANNCAIGCPDGALSHGCRGFVTSCPACCARSRSRPKIHAIFCLSSAPGLHDTRCLVASIPRHSGPTQRIKCKSASDTCPSQILPRTAMRFPKESQFGLEPACMEWSMKNHCLHCNSGRSRPHVIGSEFGQTTRQIQTADLLRNPYCDQGRDTAAVSSRTPAGSTLPIANDAPQIEMLAKRFDSGDKFSEPHYRSQILRTPQL